MQMRVLTTVPGEPGRFWGRHTTLATPLCRDIMYGRLPVARQHRLARKVAATMLRQSRDFDVVVVDGGPAGQWYSWLSAINPASQPPLLMVDCLWYRDANPARQMVKRVLKRLSARSVDLFAVWAHHEIEDYSAEFGIPAHQFVYVPFHITLEGYDFEVTDGGFVFAGGNGDRDYRVLIEAVRGTDIPVFIAATDSSLFAGIDIPHNVMIQGLSHEDFRRKMASCRVAVVPMQGGLLHSGGQQTFLNAMYLGKPTIVVGPRVAEGYITSGVNGVVVDYDDVQALRKEIHCLWSDGLLRHRLGTAAHEAAAALTTETHVKRLYELAGDLVVSRSGRHLGMDGVS